MTEKDFRFDMPLTKKAIASQKERITLEEIDKRLNNVEQLIIRIAIKQMDPETLKKIGDEIGGLTE